MSHPLLLAAVLGHRVEDFRKVPLVSGGGLRCCRQAALVHSFPMLRALARDPVRSVSVPSSFQGAEILLSVLGRILTLYFVIASQRILNAFGGPVELDFDSNWRTPPAGQLRNRELYEVPSRDGATALRCAEALRFPPPESQEVKSRNRAVPCLARHHGAAPQVL